MMAPWWVDGKAIYALFDIKAKRRQHHFFNLFLGYSHFEVG
jgi:hypothetical protein